MATRYRKASRAEKARLLEEITTLNGWTRRHARRALTQAIAAKGRPPQPRAPRPKTYGPDVLEPLKLVWAALNGPAGKRLAPFMGEIVEVLERWGELEVDPEVRTKRTSSETGGSAHLLLRPLRFAHRKGPDLYIAPGGE